MCAPWLKFMTRLKYGSDPEALSFRKRVNGEMMMKTMIVAYFGTIATFLAADALWIGIIARSFYKEQIGDLMLPSPNLPVAALFYLFFAGAIVLFAVVPALKSGAITTAMVYGGILGLAAFGTYDITNLATLKNWPLKMSLVDMAWGTFVTGLAASGGYLAATLWAPTMPGSN